MELRTADALDLVTGLLQRCRLSEPSGGVWEAADLQWWSRRERSSDDHGQLFWLGAGGEAVAATSLTDWRSVWSCDLVVGPGHEALRNGMWERALERIAELGLGAVEMLVRDDDQALRRLLAGSGFAPTGEVSPNTWLDAIRRPPVSPLPAGFRLRSRAETTDRPHHMILRNGEHVAERLAGCSLYDPKLDLLVETPDGEVAGYALFWADPVTRVGLVEPMRVEDAYQRRGIARHLLTAGLDGLAKRGSERLKVSYVEGNEGAKALYLGAGFRQGATCRAYARRF